MDPNNHAPPQLTAEAAAHLQEGINLVLSRWASLQMAVANEWGGRGSREKSQELSERIFSFFTQSKEQVYIDDLEEILDKFMISDFNTEAGDESIEEVAEKMMIMHEQCAEGNFESINELKQTNPGNSAVTYRRQDASDEEEEDDDGGDAEDDKLGDESSDMAVDSSECQASLGQKDMMVDEPRANGGAETEDGWTVVSSRRKNGRRN